MSQPDYAQAKWTPSPNFWDGYDQRDFIVVHATASGDGATEYVPNFDASTGKSTHYAVAMDGGVVQYVEEKNSAWGNCCASGNSSFVNSNPPGYNWNKSTVSIENEKHSTDNSAPLTPPQYQSLLKLVRDIAHRWNIPLQHGSLGTRGVIYHHDIDPVNKGLCPGNFPYDTFFQDLNNTPQPTTGGTPLKLNADGTVVTAPFWYQLSEGESMTCGPTTCAMVQFSVEPGGKLTATSETIDQETDAIIKDVFGVTDPKQFGGVDTWGHDMYNMLVYLRDKYKKMHFLEVSTMEDLERGVRAGYPAIFGCNEADVTAWNKSTNQWVHAYTWNISAGHIPGVFAGIESNTGNWLVVDPLNNRFQGYGPPYIYKRADIAKSFTGGAIIQLTDWLAPIPPLNQWPANFNAQNTGGTTVTTTPAPNAHQEQALATTMQQFPTLANPPPQAILDSYKSEYMAGHAHGILVASYANIDWSGAPIWVCEFTNGRAEDNKGTVKWY